jgi:CO/xanthine dehydrogenase Mo-binding subunit
LLEEIQIKEGKIQNASFTDYLIPTTLDMPAVRMDILELADPEAPYGLKGVGEPPTIASTPAIVAALRDATGQELTRVPVKPEQIVGIAEKPQSKPPQPSSSGYSGIGRLDEREEH